MPFVISKIVGDGKTTETAFRCAAQGYGSPILGKDPIPVHPITGIPASTFAVIEVPDGEEQKMLSDSGCFVVPKGDLPADTMQKLSAQNCVLDPKLIYTPLDVVAQATVKVEAAAAAVFASAVPLDGPAVDPQTGLILP